MANEKRLIDANELKRRMLAFATSIKRNYLSIEAIIDRIDTESTVDAVELPKGKPGDYLEWDNGTGFKQIYCISAVIICENCMRYDIEICAPVVNHPAIVRIMSREEAEKEWRDRVNAERKAEDNTNLKAVP